MPKKGSGKLTDAKKEEIRQIWINHRHDEDIRTIFKQHLGAYFNLEGGCGDPHLPPHSDWIVYRKLLRIFIDEEEAEKMDIKINSTSMEDAYEILEKTRKKAIFMLDRIFDEYGKKPEKYKDVPIEKIMKFYQIIKQAEEQSQRTEIQRHKEKRETITAFLPYQRASLQELQTLKQLFNASFDRILKLKSADSAEQPAAEI